MVLKGKERHKEEKRGKAIPGLEGISDEELANALIAGLKATKKVPDGKWGLVRPDYEARIPYLTLGLVLNRHIDESTVSVKINRL